MVAPNCDNAIIESEKTDGFFGMMTNTRDLRSRDIILNYKQLWKIEGAFRELKSTLKTRPMFHWTEDRILGHLVLCFISYLCEAYLTKRFHDRGILLKDKSVQEQKVQSRLLTVSSAMRQLSELRAVPVTVNDKTLWLRTDITGNVSEVFKAIGVKIPSKQLQVE